MPEKKPAAAAKKPKLTSGKPDKNASDAKKKSPAPSGKSNYPPDAFFGSELVAGLNQDNFESFMDDTDVALVMFYDTSEGSYESSKSEFVLAAENTTRLNHAYAAVDCKNNRDLCKAQLITKFPFFKLYSQGHLVNGEGEDKSFNHHNMKNFVENSPDYDLYPQEQKVCMTTIKKM